MITNIKSYIKTNKLFAFVAMIALVMSSCEIDKSLNDNPNEITLSDVDARLFLNGAMLANTQVQVGHLNHATQSVLLLDIIANRRQHGAPGLDKIWWRVRHIVWAHHGKAAQGDCSALKQILVQTRPAEDVDEWHDQLMHRSAHARRVTAHSDLSH